VKPSLDWIQKYRSEWFVIKLITISIFDPTLEKPIHFLTFLFMVSNIVEYLMIFRTLLVQIIYKNNMKKHIWVPDIMCFNAIYSINPPLFIYVDVPLSNNSFSWKFFLNYSFTLNLIPLSHLLKFLGGLFSYAHICLFVGCKELQFTVMTADLLLL
jgi:hypothetical protein